MSNSHPSADDDMEWITDWEYERILPNHTPAYHVDASAAMDDDASMEMMEEDDMNPLPLGTNDGQNEDSSKEISIFWTRVSEGMTEEDLQGALGLGTERASFSFPPSRHNSKNSLSLMDETLLPSSVGAPAPEVSAHTNTAPMPSTTNSHAHDATHIYNVGDEDESIMSPLQDKEGLLPPMSPSQLYDQSNARYGMLEHPTHYNHTTSHPYDDLGKSISKHSTAGSTATNTTMDMMDEETISSASFNPHNSGSGDIFERQQQLLQEVLHEVPQRNQSRRLAYELPRPSDSQQRLMREMREQSQQNKRNNKDNVQKNDTPPPSSKSEQDSIFARQQQIFQEMRGSERPPVSPTKSSYPHTLSAKLSPTTAANPSPVSVTKTLTRAGMDSEEYQKVVARLTEKNLMERQRNLLQESMKRSLETRQALHIKPTALPDYNHDKLSQVLKDIESSSRNISQTYGRR